MVIGLCLWGCNSREELAPVSETGRNQQSAIGVPGDLGAHGDLSDSTELTAEIARAKLGMPNVLDADVAGNWDTERVSQLVSDRLQEVADLLKSYPAPEVEQMRKLLDASFQCSNLRPDSPPLVYEDDVLVIRRQLDASTNGSEASARLSNSKVDESQIRDTSGVTDVGMTYSGADGFLKAMLHLSEPLRSVAKRQCKFKLFSIDLSEGNVQTLAYFHLSGQVNARHLQQSATWRCDWKLNGESDLRLVSINLMDYEEVVCHQNGSPFWSDCTTAAIGTSDAFQQQLRYSLDHWLDRTEQNYGIGSTGYQGLAIADVNGDGLDDVFLAQSGGLLTGLPNRLFVQQPDGTAVDTSVESGLGWTNGTHTALFVDLDNDGDQDVIVATSMGIILAENNGSGQFKIQQSKLTPEAPPMSLAAADYDVDGDLDIYVCCYSRRSSSQLLGRPLPFHDANNGGRNILFRNDGGWRFSNVTQSVGFEQNNRRFSFAAAWEDFDNDGDLDLYVANDYGRNNLFRNDDGQFTDVADELGVEDISAGMSVTWGDYNRDGMMDLYVSNMWSSAGNRIAYQRQFQESADDATLQQYQRHARGNSLFENVGSTGPFRDVSVPAAVTMGRWAWSSHFADINNDGWQDLLVANGFVTQEDTSDL